jgi:hypothetical protein
VAAGGWNVTVCYRTWWCTVVAIVVGDKDAEWSMC